jgi:hypothetical protein
VQKHALALGYFFLAVFCILTSAHSFIELRIPLLLAAMISVLVGVNFVSEPVLLWLRGLSSWFAKMYRVAQEPPHREPVANDEKNF